MPMPGDYQEVPEFFLTDEQKEEQRKHKEKMKELLAKLPTMAELAKRPPTKGEQDV